MTFDLYFKAIVAMSPFRHLEATNCVQRLFFFLFSFFSIFLYSFFPFFPPYFVPSQFVLLSIIPWKESFYNRSNEKYSLKIFRLLSEILFTHTGSEVYLTSCFMACRVTSSLVDSNWVAVFLMSWSKISQVSIFSHWI